MRKSMSAVLTTFALLMFAVNSYSDPREGRYLGEPPPGDQVRLFAPGVVSTCFEHSAIMFTPDGREGWFARLFPAVIYVIRQLEDGKWTDPEVAPFSGEYDDLYPYLTLDGNRIIFTSRRPVTPGGEELWRDHGNLWMVERADSGWAEPEYLGTDLNFADRLSCGSVAADGTMYLSARVERDGEGQRSLFLSRLIDGHYTTPVDLGPVINSPEPEHSPCISPDGSFLIFSSFRGGKGKSDLFISLISETGGWSEPVSIGDHVNSSQKDEYPYLTHDGKYLFFNSNRVSSLNDRPVMDGPGNIYWIDAGFIDSLR